MLGRRILRIKAFKAVYSFAENTSASLEDVRKQMDLSCEAVRDLYLFMLQLPGVLTAEAASRIEAAKTKFNPSEEERNPNMRFVRNSIASALSSDPDFRKISDKKKLSWDQYDVLVRHLYDSLRKKPWFKSYMSAEESGPRDDAKLFVKFFEEELVDNAELSDILEDLNVWWNDDLAYALTWDCRAVEDLAAGRRWAMPELYLSDVKEGFDDDRDFVRRLLRTAVTGYEDYVSLISKNTPKWDSGRICMTDLALIVCGLAEAKAFPGTPVNVIINEYVEISKYYSTPESRAFVNGILDKLLKNKEK